MIQLPKWKYEPVPRPEPGQPLYKQGERLMHLHHQALDKGDMKQAVAYWDLFAPYAFRHVISHKQNFPHNYHLPSLFSSFMPKSGGTFVHNRMVHVIGYSEFFWAITNPRHPQDVWASSAASLIYKLGGCTAHCHMTPSERTNACLQGIRDTPFWVHIRNPVDCVVASFHHYLGQAQGEGAVAEQRIRHNQSEATRLGMDMANIDRFAERHIGFFVKWLSRWTAYSRSHPGDVMYSFFGELAEPVAMFRRVLHHYGAAVPAQADFHQRLPNDRWRTKTDIRSELSRATRAKLTDLVATEFKSFPHRDRLLGG